MDNPRQEEVKGRSEEDEAPKRSWVWEKWHGGHVKDVSVRPGVV